MTRHAAPRFLFRKKSHVALMATLLALLATTITAITLLPGGTGRAVADTGNLVVDPNFTNGTSAWTVTKGATMSVVSGYGGAKAIAITNTTSSNLTVNLNDKVNTVASTVKGTTYTASAWVRVSKPKITVAVREGEWQGSTLMANTAVGAVWLTNTNWAFAHISYTAVANGSSIDLNYLAWQLPPKVTYYVSQPSLTASTPTTVTTTSSAPASTTSSTSASTSSSTSSAPAPTTSSATTSTSAAPAPTTSSAATSTSSAPTSTSAAPTTSSSSTSKLVFDDEFNGTSVDTSKWNVRNNWQSGNELSTDLASNVSEGNGVLTIEARKQTYTVGSTTRYYTSGYLDTIGLSGFEYGRWEMRAKLPQSKGLWPAFWLRGDNSSGEVDIMEAIGGMSTFASQTVFPNTMDGSVKLSHNYYLPSGTTADWHVYGFDWSPGYMSWDIDGVTVFTVTTSNASWVGTAFQDTMNIRLNLQVGGAMPNWWGYPVDSTTVFPADYVIDYVRVYQG